MEEIFLPAMGMAMESATLVEWLKQEGESVASGEEVALVESDKSTVALAAPVAGRLGRQLFGVGDAVPAGATVARVLVGDEQEEGPGASGPEREPEMVAAEPEATAAEAAAPAPATPDARPPNRLSPRERFRRATAARAPRVSAPTAPAAAAPLPTREERRRSVIAAGVTDSWHQIPHFGVARVIGADALPEALRRMRRANPDLTVTDFLLAAIVRVLRDSNRAPDVGLAVATRAGVTITVLRNLEDTPEAITQPRERAVEAARNLRSAPDAGDAPFLTLSNIGALGVSWFTGIIPIGQQALLTTGSVLEQPVVRSARVVVGASFNAVLNADHRSLDGLDAARLLRDFDRRLEDVLQEVEE